MVFHSGEDGKSPGELGALAVHRVVPSVASPAEAGGAYGTSAQQDGDGNPASNRVDAKRLFDIIFSVAALIFLMPVILVISAALKFHEGGSVLFRHERIGQGGRRFRCLKFRTMVPDAEALLAEILATDPVARAEWDSTRKLTEDPRISCLGHFLRRSSLDELPQFWNVLRGEMSVVGPRPIVSEEIEHYREDFAGYASVKPGITGLWQVSGRSDTTYEERVALDMHYVAHHSLAMDIGIVLRTVGVLLNQRGAR